MCIINGEVRVATLDCVAVVAHLLGAGNLGPLLSVVPHAGSDLNNSNHSDSIACANNSILEAVQRRLARRQLPQLDSQCRVVRGFSIGITAPSVGHHRNGHVFRSAGPLEASSEVVALTDLEDAGNVSHRKRAYFMSNSALHPNSASKGLRRRPSAGSNNRLPWDPQAGSAGSIASSSGVSSAASPRCLDSGSVERNLLGSTPTESHLLVGTF
ncbi:unnamed protein product [Echinostoma caproni]|uniref:Uncharacterized protein n=1 Tax=Echinostoma caproni TaxID=27848 RepID=A0A183AJ91_9TREM|nr:unnamed protein product [Echinostoma caproni]